MKKVERRDGWKNTVTLLGTAADKRQAAQIHYDLRPPEFYEELYSAGGIPARIVDLVPEDSLKNWLDFTDIEPEKTKKMHDVCEALGVRHGVGNTWKWGRAYGGGCLHIVTDTKYPSLPMQKGEKVIGLRDLSRWDVRIITTDVEADFASPNFGHPNIYYLNVQMGSQYKGYPIHWTRMIRFDGQLVPRRTFIRNNYWHDSVLNRLYNSIRNYEQANDSASATLLDFNVDVYKLKNLANLIASGKQQVVKDRIEMMSYSKSVLNAMILDTDIEDYENKSRSLEGIAELLDHQANRLVAETDIPHTKLLGQSPDGSNATGNSTSQNWYNYIKAEQENYLRPKLKRLFQLIFGGEVEFKFKPLRTLDDVEQADVRLKVAQTDEIYLNQGVLDPDEVAQSRFGGDEYTTETVVDWDARESGKIVPGQQDMGNEPDGDESPDDDQKNGNESDDKGGKSPSNKGSDGKSSSTNKKDSDDDQVYGLRNNELTVTPSEPKIEPIVSQTMSEPMRDPDLPAIKPGGTPNEPRVLEPEVGNGITANSQKADGDFKEGDHPRKENGEFGSGGGSSYAAKGKQVEAASNAFSSSQERLKSSESSLLKLQSENKHMTPEYEAARKEHRSAKRAHQINTKSANSLVASSKTDDDVEAPRMRAACVIVRRGDQFLMGKTRNGSKWTLPGGVVERNESMKAGALRELAEETGLTAKSLKFLGTRLVEPEQGNLVEVAMYEHKADEDAKPTGRHDPDKEVSKWQWFDSTKPLDAEVLGNLKHANNVALDHMGLLK